MRLDRERLQEIAVELASRPAHEKVRTLIAELLVNGLGAASGDVQFERRVPEVRGRIDALLGRTLFEFKTDLRRERADAEEELSRYLADRERESGERYVGIATDGVSFLPYELRNGQLTGLPSFVAKADDGSALLAWLGAAVAVSSELDPTPSTVTRELGRDSLAWHVARRDLLALWDAAKEQPDVLLKRDLWARLLERVYGSAVDSDELFTQHTYLTIVAKTMATHVLGMDVSSPEDLLAGKAFREAGIGGAVEADFFDWPLAAGGDRLVTKIASQAARFRLRDIETDVLRGLYESLIDPEQRHDLGEYFTPDWLAQRMCGELIDNPLERRVFDPACGSGTFLFHAIRRFLSAAAAEGLKVGETFKRLTENVVGVDIHPVSVQIARVTYLLAIGEKRLRRRPSSFTVPVYLGDSLQWNTRGFLVDREVVIEVPGGGGDLEFPVGIAGDPSVFDDVVASMIEMSRDAENEESFARWLKREHGELDAKTVETTTRTYGRLRDLQQGGRDHIWGFVARNLVRPIWLSQVDMRADVVIGNPPWLSYNRMAPSIQERFKAESLRTGVWVGGRGVTPHQDLSAYFFARCVELYLKPEGRIAFVMPYAAMSRSQFANFLTGVFGERRSRGRIRNVVAAVHFTSAWVLSDSVRPLFPVPSCVLFAEMQAYRPGADLEAVTVLPRTVMSAAGTLPRRDATPAEADDALTWQEVAWPSSRADATAAPSEYGALFRQGAIIIPRVLWMVDRVAAGRMGANPNAPLVESHRSSQEKAPWKDVTAVRGNVESEFLRDVYLGESIAPFRLLTPGLAVIPWDPSKGELVDAAGARTGGYRRLAGWLSTTEQLWGSVGRGKRSLGEQLDFYGQLSAQFPPAPVRVLYTASGSLPAAAVLRDSVAVIEHKLYWMAARDTGEADYLVAVLNSETARERVAHLQSRGQWGARDFDKVMLSLPIPRFDTAVTLHAELSSAGSEAQRLAAGVPLRPTERFVAARQQIRKALEDNGVLATIEALVGRLLGGAGVDRARS